MLTYEKVNSREATARYTIMVYFFGCLDGSKVLGSLCNPHKGGGARHCRAMAYNDGGTP
jgi:hypothetical protein